MARSAGAASADGATQIAVEAGTLLRHPSSAATQIAVEAGTLLRFFGKKVLHLENHASSLSLFVDLAAMTQGELRIEANYSGDDRGVLHIDKDGGLISMPHFRSISSIDFQMHWALDELREIAKHETD